jgi:hypothetical protein
MSRAECISVNSTFYERGQARSHRSVLVKHLNLSELRLMTSPSVASLMTSRSVTSLMTSLSIANLMTSLSVASLMTTFLMSDL